LYQHSFVFFFFFSSRRRHTRFSRDWSSDVCSCDLRSKITGSGSGKQVRAREFWGSLQHPFGAHTSPGAVRLGLVMQDSKFEKFRSALFESHLRKKSLFDCVAERLPVVLPVPPRDSELSVPEAREGFWLGME